MNERTVFLEALDKGDSAERAAFLDAACGNDPALRRRVDALLASHQAAGSFLGHPAIDPTADEAVTPGDPAETSEAGVSTGQPRLDFLAPPERPDSLGRLDHYEVLEIVGQGGMGIVLRAFDDKLHRVVALKVMAKDFTGSPAARKRFNREAKAAAAVVHDHIVPIHAVEEAGPVPYLVMQFIEGRSLQQKINDEGSLELKEILRIGLQAARGLAAAHRQGLVHRDIKPANLLLENGVQRVKITDFGLARLVDDATISQSGIISGTPQYMSPEQADGQSVDHRSDLFSLGSVLYAMATGRPPFRADSAVATLKRVCEATPRPLRELNPDLPEWLGTLIAKLHAKDPAQRFQSAAEVADVLERQLALVQQGTVESAPPWINSPSYTPPARRTNWWNVAKFLAPLAVLVAILGLLVFHLDETIWYIPSYLVILASAGMLEPAISQRRTWRQQFAARPVLSSLAVLGLLWVTVLAVAIWQDWLPAWGKSTPPATGVLRLETTDPAIFFEIDHYQSSKQVIDDRRVFEWTLPEGEQYFKYHKLEKGIQTGGFRSVLIHAGQTTRLAVSYDNRAWIFSDGHPAPAPTAPEVAPKATAPPSTSPTLPEAHLYGRWDLVSVEYQGQPVDLKQKLDMFPSVMILSHKQYGLLWGKQRHEGALRLDLSKTPAEIDFSGSIFHALKPRKALLELQGERLKLALPYVGPNSDPPRPTDFTTSPTSKNAVLLYERKK